MKKHFLKNIIFILLSVFSFFISIPANSQIPPGDQSYFEQNFSKQLKMFFAEEHVPYYPLLYKKAYIIDAKLKELFLSTNHNKNKSTLMLSSQKMKELLVSPNYNKAYSISFLSSLNQIPNTLANVYPNPYVSISFPALSRQHVLATNDWIGDALIHELTHIYQLRRHNSPIFYWLTYLFPEDLYPNLLMPNFILEGHAVLMESMYGSGGRLFNGSVRALVLSQIQQDISFRRIFNSYNDAFSSQEKYYHGAYFLTYLHTLYPLKTINELFSTYSENFWFPIGIYGINRAMKKTFGKSFYTLFEDYKKHYKPLAKKQKTSKEKILLKSQLSTFISSDSKNIFFLTSDTKSPTLLNIFNKKNQTLIQKKVDMPFGKVFIIDGKYYSSGIGRTSRVSSEYALFANHYKILENSNSQYIMATSKNKTVSIDVKKSFYDMQIFINKKFYDDTDSVAVMDSADNVYYFKNKKDKMILYKNKKPLMSYKGYSSFPVEATQTTLYFIAPTLYGSSLFAYTHGNGRGKGKGKSNGKILRLSSSDTIIHAQKINDGEFLVSEASSRSYHYKIIKISKTKEQPYLYKYSFKKQALARHFNLKNVTSLKNSLNNSQTSSKKIASSLSSNKKSNENNSSSAGNLDLDYLENNPIKKYQPFLSWRWTNINFNFLITPKSFKESKNLNMRNLENWNYRLQTNFSLFDYLSYHAIDISNLLSTDKKHLHLSYKNQKYRTAFEISPIRYEQGFFVLDKNSDYYLIKTFQHLQFFQDHKNIQNLLKDFEEKKQAQYKSQQSQTSNNQESKQSKQSQTSNNQESKQSKQSQTSNNQETQQSNDQKVPQKNTKIAYKSYSFSLFIESPIYQRSRHQASFKEEISFKQIQFNDNSWIPYIKNSGSLDFHYKRKYPFAFSSYKELKLSVFYDSELIPTKNKYQNYLSGGASIFYNQELARELFFSASGIARTNITNRSPQMVFQTPEQGQQALTYMQSLQDIYLLDIKLRKVINYSWHPIIIPIAFSRLAIFGGSSFASFKDEWRDNKNQWLYSAKKSSILNSKAKLGLKPKANSDLSSKANSALTSNPENPLQHSYFINPYIALEIELSLLHTPQHVQLGISGGPVLEWVNSQLKYKQFQLGFHINNNF